jgi:hypothetical protein
MTQVLQARCGGDQARAIGELLCINDPWIPRWQFFYYFLFHSYCIIKLWYVFCCRLCEPGLVEALCWSWWWREEGDAAGLGWGERIYNVSRGSIGCSHKTWVGSLTLRRWLHSMPRWASQRCAHVTISTGWCIPSWCLISSLSRTVLRPSDGVSTILPSTTCLWERGAS